MIDDLIKNTQENLKKFKILSANDIVSLDKSVVCFSDSMKKNEIELKKFLKEKNVYASQNKNNDFKG